MTLDKLPKSESVEYRTIDGFPDYAVGDDGSVWSKRVGGRWKEMSPTTDAWGYKVVALYYEKWKSKRCKVHGLVLEAFVGRKPSGMEGRHFPNDDKTDNRLANLKWGTRKENMADKAAIGTQLRGEMVPGAKLNESIVLEIRSDRSAGMTIDSLSKKYGISANGIYDITIGRNWKHVGGPIAPRIRPFKSRKKKVAT